MGTEPSFSIAVEEAKHEMWHRFGMIEIEKQAYNIQCN